MAECDFDRVCVPSGAIPGVTFGPILCEATFETIAWDIPVTEAGGSVVDVRGWVRLAEPGSPILPALPAWRSPGQPFWSLAATELEPGRRYRWWLAADGADGSRQILIGAVTTRAEVVPSHAELLGMVTHYVDAAVGDDANPGICRSAPWRTVDKAWSDAPAGAVVELGDHDHVRATPYTSTSGQNGRTTTIALVGRTPACGEAGNPTPGPHARIIPPATHRIGPNAGRWAQVPLAGPGHPGNNAAAGTVYTVWKATTGLAGIKHLHWATALGAELTRMPVWARDGVHLGTPEGWIEKLMTNRAYHYGAYATATGDLYIRCYGDVDPNTRYWVIGENGVPFITQAPDSRISGIHFWGWPHGPTMRRATSVRTTFDRNLIEGPQFGIYLYSGGTTDYPTDALAQANAIVDRGVRGPWGTAQVDTDVIPWQLIKGQIKNADGTTYPTAKLAGNCETSAILSRGGGRRTVVRRNLIRGTNNGIAHQNSGYDRLASFLFDSSENRIADIPDDGLEPELQAVNWLSRRDSVERSLTIISLGPVHHGPLYLIDPRAWRWGTSGMGVTADGAVPGSVGFKYSGTSSPPAKLFVLGGEAWTDDPGASGGDRVATVGTSEEFLEFFGFIMRAGRYAFVAPNPSRFAEDGCLWATADATRGIWVGPTVYQSWAAYMAATGQGERSNDVAGVRIEPIDAAALDELLADPTTGDLTPALPPGGGW